MKIPRDVSASSESRVELPDNTVLASYFAGEDDAVAKASVEAWVGNDVQRREALERWRNGWDGAGRGPVQGDLQGFLQTLWGKIGEDEKIVVRERSESSAKQGVVAGHRGKQALWRWVWSAGTMVVVMLAMFLLHAHGRGTPGMTRTYSTRANQQGTVTLNDGTQVTLSPNTTVRLVAFGRQTRTVALDRGEAYFDVARSSTMPFVVQTGGATIRVLGTVFLVRNDSSALRTHVAVSEGRVRVNDRWHPDALTTLSAGRAAEIADSNMHVTVGETLAPGTEWAHDRVLFHDTPVSVVLATLGRWYGYKFRCTDPELANMRVTIVVSAKSSASALATLENVLDVNLTVAADTITLTPYPAQQSKNVVPRMRAYDVWTPTREVGR